MRKECASAPVARARALRARTLLVNMFFFVVKMGLNGVEMFLQYLQ